MLEDERGRIRGAQPAPAASHITAATQHVRQPAAFIAFTCLRCMNSSRTGLTGFHSAQSAGGDCEMRFTFRRSLFGTQGTIDAGVAEPADDELVPHQGTDFAQA